MDEAAHSLLAEPVGSIHPLAPLEPDEIATVVAVVRASATGAGALFETIELKEPAKSAFAAWPLRPVPREARANICRPDSPGVWRLVVSLDDMAVLSTVHVPEARPMIQLEKFLAIEAIVRGDPAFIAACARRGITDMASVCIDPWSAGNFGIEGEEGGYLSHTFCWLRLRENENFYAHPIEGLNAVVDIHKGEVIRVDDYGVMPIPMAEVNYEAQFRSDFRPPLKPLDVVQPEGPSFVLEGHAITWDKWSLVVGFNAREAITLHDIRYDGRPVCHRASLVEMVVPYGTPANGHYRKNVFDIGEYGLGKLANSLKLGCDCLGHIAYLDAHLNTMNGEVMTIENAVCIHEEDSGILWKHWDFRTERTEVRRGRRLVISCICTVGNYEYASYWYLKQDGSIEFEMKATGIINTAACLPGRPSKYGAEVSPGVEGHIHQHAFCARLDMAVDGPNNSVVECNTIAEPAGPDNPYGNAFYVQETALRSELAACRRAEPATQRYWKVVNPSRLNHVGRPVSYKLEPSHTIIPFVRPESPSGRRATFMQNHLWVTAHDPEERYPAGEYMNHSDGSGGIADFVKQDRSIENADIVLWHVFGLHHLPRTEDFPVQSCISTGFRLTPNGFFDQNPGIDLKPDVNRASRTAGGHCCGP
ncbi:MAG: primary-amine oxidase [Alphaproteobacteria bacterium]|nr:primary-amine oxidase [Alphaproteobacteria bacterium]